MAILFELDAEWPTWLQSVPENVRKVAEQWPANKLYRLSGTGQRVTIIGYREDGKVTVDVTGEYNLMDFDREVFGVDPSRLTECELPAPGEPVGTLIKEPAELQRYLKAMREAVLARRTANPDDPYGKTKQ